MFILVFLLLLSISEKCLSTSVISGGSYCTPSGQGSHYAVPGTVITVNCSVDNLDNLDNLLKWTIPSYDVQISHLYDRRYSIVYIWPFKSTVISSDNTAKTTTASLQISAVSNLDGAVVRCADASNNMASCILQILSKFQCYH